MALAEVASKPGLPSVPLGSASGATAIRAEGFLLGEGQGVTPGLKLAAVLVLILATLAGLLGGPLLGDHEALVAECAREMRLSGDWLVPTFLDTAFIRKPPLGYWLVAAGSYVLPPAAETGLPVSTAGARLPSALAALGTVLLVWKLAAAMFGHRVGIVAAFLSSAAAFSLLFAVNATVEMLLTFCCTWAYVHFWFAFTTRSPGARFRHLMGFYVAMGVGMLAKGPAPMALAAVPLAFWWFTYRAQRFLAAGGPQAGRRFAAEILRGVRTQTLRAFTRLWLIPGIFVFAAVFVPWMILVARQHEGAWDMWNWQYLQRFQGDYEDTRDRSPFYYLPMVLGLLAPWTPAIIEGLLAPWLPRYRRWRRALYFVGIWGVLGVVAMSAMKFKKPYYILPAMPAFALLAAVVLERFLSRVRIRPLLAWASFAGLCLALAVGVAWGNHWLHLNLPERTVLLTVLLGALAAALATSSWLYAIGRPFGAFLGVAVTMVVGFQALWYAAAPHLVNVRRVEALDLALDHAGVPEDAKLYWADQRPDARLKFYFGRGSHYMVPPAEILKRAVDRTGSAKLLVASMALDRAKELLGGGESVYLIMDREHLDLLKQLPAETARRARVITTVDLDRHPDEDDWVVVSNRAARSAVSESSDSPRAGQDRKQ